VFDTKCVEPKTPCLKLRLAVYTEAEVIETDAARREFAALLVSVLGECEHHFRIRLQNCARDDAFFVIARTEDFGTAEQLRIPRRTLVQVRNAEFYVRHACDVWHIPLLDFPCIRTLAGAAVTP
jgi:hypothetical protein